MLAKHPASSFFICEYKEQFFGLLFSLHLKKDIFEKLMNFEMQEVDIKDEHFVVDNEVGCEYLLNFFSYSQKVAALLFISYYNYLIDNQKQIIEIGVGTMMDEGHKLIQRLNLSHYKDIQIDSKHTLSFYRQTLKDVLINESILKILF